MFQSMKELKERFEAEREGLRSLPVGSIIKDSSGTLYECTSVSPGRGMSMFSPVVRVQDELQMRMPTTDETLLMCGSVEVVRIGCGDSNNWCQSSTRPSPLSRPDFLCRALLDENHEMRFSALDQLTHEVQQESSAQRLFADVRR